MLNAPRKKSSTEGSAFCVVRAEFMGFCGGVENAVLMTEEAVARYGALGRAVYSCGPVIHNAAVME
jgi:4-hydroxy-3-methylbut-2-enyl diphosphate reductase IspH